MPQSKHVNPGFQQALKGAIGDFKAAKRPLWEHHKEEIGIMEKVVNNADQTNRELRDGAQQACREINRGWRHWFVSSLLTDHVEEVLADPQFNVEILYEAVIDQQGECIEQQAVAIAALKDENDKLAHDKLPAYYQDLRTGITTAKQALAEADKKHQETTGLLEKTRRELQAMEIKYNESEQNYQTLQGEYMDTLNQKSNPTKKKFKVPLQAGTYHPEAAQNKPVISPIPSSPSPSL